MGAFQKVYSHKHSIGKESQFLFFHVFFYLIWGSGHCSAAPYQVYFSALACNLQFLVWESGPLRRAPLFQISNRIGVVLRRDPPSILGSSRLVGTLAVLPSLIVWLALYLVEKNYWLRGSWVDSEVAAVRFTCFTKSWVGQVACALQLNRHGSTPWSCIWFWWAKLELLFVQTFSDDFGVFGLTTVFCCFWSCCGFDATSDFHRDLVQRCKFRLLWRNHTFTLMWNSLQSRGLLLDVFQKSFSLISLLALETEKSCQGEQDTRTTVKTLWFVWLVKRKLSVLWTFCLSLEGLDLFGLVGNWPRLASVCVVWKVFC